MDEKKLNLINKAQEQYGAIRPCDKKQWEDCFSTYDNKLILWFNSEDNSTHILQQDN
jgi:hypothetical protein